MKTILWVSIAVVAGAVAYVWLTETDSRDLWDDVHGTV